MDGQLHRQYRRMIEPYFSSACRGLQAEVPGPQPQSWPMRSAHAHVEAMKYFAEPFAARLQCLFMGWDESLALCY